MGIRSAIRSWLNGPEEIVDFETRSTPTGVKPPPRIGVGATANTSLTLPAVYRAVTLISSGVSQLTVDVWRGQEQIKAPQWITRPDIKISRLAFLEQTVTSLVTQGNAFWRVIRSSPADPVEALVVVDPNDVFIEDHTDTFQYRGKTLQPWQMQHLALLRIPGQRRGLGPIQSARLELSGAIDMRDYSANWFTAGSIPNAVLKSDSMLTGEDAKRYKDAFLEAVNANEPIVLGQGLAYSPIFLSPKDAQFLESREFSTSEIARLFGVPAHLLLINQEGSSQTYANVQDADLSFTRWTLMRYIREVEEAFTSLLPRTQVARFNVDAILRASTKARYEAHKIALEAKFLTIDEVREIEGLDPLGETND